MRNVLSHVGKNVVGYVALFFALGLGSAWAATELQRNDVRSKHIAKGQVKTSDLAKGSVKAAKLRAGSVDGTKVVDGALGGADIDDGTLSGADVGGSSLDGSDIGDDSLTGVDVDESSLGSVPSASDADSLGGIDASSYGTLLTKAGDFGMGSSFFWTFPGIGSLRMTCDPGGTTIEQEDDVIDEVVFWNQSGAPLIIESQLTRSEEAEGRGLPDSHARGARVADGDPVLYYGGTRAIFAEFLIAEPVEDGMSLRISAGASELPGTACQAAAQAVLRG